MFSFRKISVEIEAWQFLDGEVAPLELQDVLCHCEEGGDKGRIHIHTLEGAMSFSHGDWIIKGVEGEFYPCKESIFAKTYEPVGEDTERYWGRRH
jgi:hypothetical protein